jgi:hypothetical protein
MSTTPKPDIQRILDLQDLLSQWIAEVGEYYGQLKDIMLKNLHLFPDA